MLFGSTQDADGASARWTNEIAGDSFNATAEWKLSCSESQHVAESLRLWIEVCPSSRTDAYQHLFTLERLSSTDHERRVEESLERAASGCEGRHRVGAAPGGMVELLWCVTLLGQGLREGCMPDADVVLCGRRSKGDQPRVALCPRPYQTIPRSRSRSFDQSVRHNRDYIRLEIYRSRGGTNFGEQGRG
jgi:hypothetical protein